MSKKPQLIIIGGFAGAGKTTITRRLSAEYGLTLYSSDIINDVLRSTFDKSFKEMSPHAYKIMWHLIKNQLELGGTVLVDAHMAAQHVWDSLDELKQQVHGLVVKPIILQATLDNHRSRIEQRGRTNKQHLNLGGDKLEDVLFKYEFIESLDRPDIIWVDANGDPDSVYANVKKALGNSLR